MAADLETSGDGAGERVLVGTWTPIPSDSQYVPSHPKVCGPEDELGEVSQKMKQY